MIIEMRQQGILELRKVRILMRINLTFLCLKSKDVVKFWFKFRFVLTPKTAPTRKMKTENNLFIIPIILTHTFSLSLV